MGAEQVVVLSLMGFVGITLTLVSAIGAMRVGLVLQGHRAGSFLPDGTDVGPFSHRLNRAYLNCTENLPAFAALTLGALAFGRADLLAGTAPVVVLARLGQAVTHVSSTRARWVTLRFAFFLVQVGIELFWLVRLVLAALE